MELVHFDVQLTKHIITFNNLSHLAILLHVAVCHMLYV